MIIRTQAVTDVSDSDGNTNVWDDARAFLDAYRDRHPLAIATLFGGDRWSCVSDVVIAYSSTDNTTPIALATVSDWGENYTGQPAIMGLLVAGEYRRMGIGQRVLETAVRLAIETYLPESDATTILITGLNPAIAVMVDRLPDALRHLIEYRDMTQGGLSKQEQQILEYDASPKVFWEK